MPSHPKALTPASPFPLRLNAYLRERFPVAGHGVLVVCFYAANHLLAQVLTNGGALVRCGLWCLAGIVTVFCFFFHLRVFDEHKDFADDSRHHGERVLQRGIVTLHDLRVLGGTAVAVEFVLAALRGPAAVVSLVAAVLFSVLMLKEFFVRNWLKRHFVVYALSHMLIMPFLAAVTYSFATGAHFWRAPGWFWVYAAAGFLAGLGLEVSRKMRAPGEEIDGVDSYTKVFGTHRTGYVVIAIRAVEIALVTLVAGRLGLPRWFFTILAILLAMTVAGAVHFRLRTDTKTADRMETYASLHLLVANVALAVAIAWKYGVVWETIW